MTNRRSLKRLLLFALGIALPLTAGCHSVNGVSTPSTLMAHMKTISLGRTDMQVPEDATVSMIGELDDAKLHVEQLPAGQTFAKVWAERLKQIGSGQGNDPGPGQTRIRKIYPASGSAGQVFYEQSPSPKVLLVIERWQMVGDYLVKGRMELQEKYFNQAEQGMPAMFASMSLDPARGRDDYALGPVTAHYPSQGGESVEAAIRFSLPADHAQQKGLATLTLDSDLLASRGSIDVLARMKLARAEARGSDTQVSVARARRRTVGTLAGEEGVLVLTTDNPRGTALRAEWGTPGTPNDASAPQTELELVSPDKISVDPRKVLSEWDNILSSLHYRP